MKNDSRIRLFSGVQFDPMKPDASLINIEDIAHALSNQCRFSGHVRKMLSVAQHCVNVSLICPPKFQLHGLLHDASEAYLQDVARPIKYAKGMEAYIKWEKRLQRVIYKRFGLNPKEPKQVKDADNRMLVRERMDLINGWEVCSHTKDIVLIGDEPGVSSPMAPEEAEAAFLERYYKLTQK